MNFKFIKIKIGPFDPVKTYIYTNSGVSYCKEAELKIAEDTRDEISINVCNISEIKKIDNICDRDDVWYPVENGSFTDIDYERKCGREKSYYVIIMNSGSKYNVSILEMQKIFDIIDNKL